MGLGLAGALLLVLAGASPAAADASVEIIWTATTGGGTTGGATITAQNGDTLTAEVRITAGAEPLGFYSVSIEFDTALDDELDLVSAVALLPPGFDFNGGPSSTQESSLAQEGNALAFQGLVLAGVSNTTFAAAELQFTVNAPDTDGDDVFTGFFNGGDQIFQNDLATPITTSFQDAAVDAASTLPVPFAAQAVITTQGDSARFVSTGDLDGDGDLDVLSTSVNDEEVTWSENTAGDASAWTTTTIDTLTDSPQSIVAADLDGDGDLDALVAVLANAGEVRWYENQDGQGGFGSAQTITTAADGAIAAIAADVDGDGDLDVVSVSFLDDEVSWHENPGGALPSFTTHVIDEDPDGGGGLQGQADGAGSVAAADFDRDGDLDLVVLSSDDGEISWLENDGTPAVGPWTFHAVGTFTPALGTVVAADVDGDGDVDVVSAEEGDDEVSWFENDGTPAVGSWTEHPIASAEGGAFGLAVADLDRDGDLDAVSTALDDGRVRFHENTVGDGSAWSSSTLSSDVLAPRAAAIGDLDGDGDLDVLSASQNDDKIAWYENLAIHRSAVFLASDEVVISGAASSASSIVGADMDGDGDLDALSAVSPADTIAWWRNDDGAGTAWTQVSIDTGFTGGANTVIAGDVDGDGDLDAVATSAAADTVAWFENTDAVGTSWSTHAIPSTSDAPGPPRAADVDGDGDLDVVTASSGDGRLLWYENTAGDGSAWTERTVVTVTGGGPIVAADFDVDGDVDLVFAFGGGGANDNSLFAYENTAGDGSAWTGHEIESNEGPFSWISVADIDGQGLPDLFVTQNSEDRVLFYENVGGMTIQLYESIYGGLDNVKAVEVGDLDGDGDMDLAYASADDDTVGWIERLDSAPLAFNWDVHPITTSADFASRVFVGDVDGDGDPDVMASSAIDATLAWYPNRGGQFGLRTFDVAPPFLLELDETEVLRFEVSNRGRAGDGDLRITNLPLRYLDGAGAPLTNGQANALFSDVSVYLDQGPPGFQGLGGIDDVVATLASFTLDPDGRQILPVSVLPAAEVAATETRTYLVVPTLESGAASASPSDFRIVLEPETIGAAAVDLVHVLPLDLEAGADASSAAVTAWTLDSDGDGVADHEEAVFGTNAASEDSDADGLTDGEELFLLATDPVAANNSADDPDLDGLGHLAELLVHGTNPILNDSDGDGVDDGTEVGGAGDPSSSHVPADFVPIESSLTSAIAGTPGDIDGDGDLDVPAMVDGDLVWYENLGSLSGFNAFVGVATPFSGSDPSIVPVDLDRDGHLDLLTLSGEGVHWHRNVTGAGVTWSDNTIATPASPSNQVLPADMDGDGDIDVVAAAGSDVTWYENDGSEGTWTAHTLPVIGVGPTFALADLDGDGDVDVVAAGSSSPPVWHENADGNGTAWKPRPVLAGAASGAVGLAVGDLDGDRDLDLAVSLSGSGRVHVVWNLSGDGRVLQALPIARGGSQGLPPLLADADGDGDLDVFDTEVGDNVVFFENRGAGVFARRRMLSGLTGLTRLLPTATPGLPAATGATVAPAEGAADLGLAPPCCARADVDGDGDLDAVWSRLSGTAEIGWLENLTIHRSARFPESIEIDAGAPQLQEIVPADLDGDGWVDVVGTNEEFTSGRQVGKVVWYRNPGPALTPWVEQAIDLELLLARGVRAGDVDGDGDLDVVVQGLPVIGAGLVSLWYENRAGDGSTWDRHGMTSGSTWHGLDLGDVDGDGDLDALTPVEWIENTAGDGSAWVRDSYATGNGRVAFDDMDGDGDLDLLVYDLSQVPSARIIFYPNLDGMGGTAGGITVTEAGARPFTTADVDGDGDLDVVSSSFFARWHENTAGDGSAWTDHTIADVHSSSTQVETGDVDGDGDTDVLASGVDARASWWLNLDGVGTSWAEQPVETAATGFTAPGMATADFDRDGDLDVVTQERSGPTFPLAWHPNRGGQLALPTASVAGTGGIDDTDFSVLAIDATHRGRLGDTDAELAEIELRWEDEGGALLSGFEVDDLIKGAEIWLDDGSGVWESGSDTLVQGQGPANVIHFVLPDGDADVQIAQGTPRTYFVVVQLEADASMQSPNRFQVVHVTESSSEAEDATTDFPLALEFHADTSSGVVQALAPGGDEDSDGLSNADEVNVHGTDPLDDDTDGDGLLDGDEVNVHGSSPLLVDTDADGLTDDVEVALGSGPSDEDTDSDGVCDGGNLVGTCTQAGPDNCVHWANPGQENGDAAPQGDACQCGDVSGGDGLITAADVQAAREHVVGATPTLPFVDHRCNVVGPSDLGVTDCDVQDVFLLDRIAGGATATIGTDCTAFAP